MRGEVSATEAKIKERRWSEHPVACEKTCACAIVARDVRAHEEERAKGRNDATTSEDRPVHDRAGHAPAGVVVQKKGAPLVTGACERTGKRSGGSDREGMKTARLGRGGSRGPRSGETERSENVGAPGKRAQDLSERKRDEGERETSPETDRALFVLLSRLRIEEGGHEGQEDPQEEENDRGGEHAGRKPEREPVEDEPQEMLHRREPRSSARPEGAGGDRGGEEGNPELVVGNFLHA
jgi:hypothetical protein